MGKLNIPPIEEENVFSRLKKYTDKDRNLLILVINLGGIMYDHGYHDGSNAIDPRDRLKPETRERFNRVLGLDKE